MNEPLPIPLVSTQTETTEPGAPHILRDLQDPERDHALESCIAALDLTAKTVVDLRGGLGVNALRFAKYGAMRVLTVVPGRPGFGRGRATLPLSIVGMWADRVSLRHAGTEKGFCMNVPPQEMTYLRTVGRISFFAAISYAVDYSFQLIDMFWVAQLGAVAPTAIMLVSALLFAVLALNEIIGVSTVSLLSQSVGRGEARATGQLVLDCLAVKLAVGAAMAVLFLVTVFGTVWWQGLEGPLRDMVLSYAVVIWPSLLLVPVYSTVMTVLRCVGMEAGAAVISAVILGVNALLTPLLVMGWGTVEGMGIAGAAWATITAQAVALAMSLIVLVCRRPELEVFRQGWPSWRPPLYRKLVVIGFPIGVMMVVYSLENVLLANMMLDYPIAVSDGFGIGGRIFGLVLIVNLGVTVGVGIGTGRFIGSQSYESIRRGALHLAIGLALTAVIAALGAQVWVPPLAGAFVDNPEAIASAVRYTQIMLVANCFLIVTYTLNGVFEGAGATLPILLAGLLSYVGIEFPMLFLVHNWFPGEAELLWSVVTMAAAVGMIATLVFFHRAAWIRHIRVRRHEGT